MPEGINLALWVILAAISICGSIRLWGNGHKDKEDWKREKEELLDYLSDYQSWLESIRPRLHHRFDEQDSIDFENKVRDLDKHIERRKRNGR